MKALNDENVFKQYYQVNYDFNTTSLTKEEIDEIKSLAKEKRVNYALAPIGEKIFNFIIEQNANINFELVKFDTTNVDGMLYIPESGNDKAYIILNGNKPFINQIFAAAHEYYHYIKDYEQIKKNPYVCCLSSLLNVNEKKASRFAAELLLPDEALRSEIKLFKKKFNCSEKKKLSFNEYAIISILLTIKYQIPLKAVIYRLCEEKFIENITKFVADYDVIKKVLMQIEILKDKVEYLYGTENSSLKDITTLYQQIEIAYKRGLASRTEILTDAEKLRLNLNLIKAFFDVIDDDEDEDKDDDIIRISKELWGGE